MKRKAFQTSDAPNAVGPYSQAVDAGDFVFLSGQVGIVPSEGRIVAEDAAGQAEQVMKNLAAVLASADLTFDNVVKTTIYLASMDDFAAVNEAYAPFFDGDPPARATFAVSALPLGALVEIEAVARR